MAVRLHYGQGVEEEVKFEMTVISDVDRDDEEEVQFGVTMVFLCVNLEGEVEVKFEMTAFSYLGQEGEEEV